MKTILIVLLLITVPLCAQEFGQVGTSGAQFLKINFDPRASGLGYAAASVVSGASAMYTNVAGIELIKSFDVTSAYVPWFADIKMASLSAAFRLENIGVIGLQASGFSTDEEITTIDMENGTGQMYSIQNMVVGVSFARHITDKLVSGIQAKYYRESYYGHSTGGLAFDVGTNYDLEISGASLGLSLQNFGPNLPALSGTYHDYSDNNSSKSFNDTPLPVTFRASFSFVPVTMEDYHLRVIADLVHPNDNVEHYNVGAELIALDVITLRGGLKINYDDETFALGVGVDGSSLIGQNLRLDYSFENFSILPSIQKISIGYSF
ncbi:MAG TPA: PorV/PorQ family protein [Bacteroidota bacterium]